MNNYLDIQNLLDFPAQLCNMVLLAEATFFDNLESSRIIQLDHMTTGTPGNPAQPGRACFAPGIGATALAVAWTQDLAGLQTQACRAGQLACMGNSQHQLR